MPQASYSRKIRGHSSGSIKWGKIQLLAIFVVLELLDFSVYILYADLPASQHRIIGTLIVHAIWSIVCVIAMWRRQNWARYLLIFWLLFSVCVAGLMELGVTTMMFDPSRLVWAVSITAGHLILAIILIASPDIRKLTRPDLHQESW